ncbi:MAG: molybdenum cofactor guanylyltransferase [Deferrisomatales bacterium]
MKDRVGLAAILAGGRARRMGADKAGLPLAGVPLIEHVWARLVPVAERVITVGGRPWLAARGVEAVADRYPEANSMGGIATALAYAARGGAGEEAWVLAVACDMPFLEPALLHGLWGVREGWDAVVPRVQKGYEPLCALYRSGCLPVFEREIARGNLRVLDIFRAVRTREVPEAELRRWDPELRSFWNINRPEDLERAVRELSAPLKRPAAG